jgi:uncharacterized UBP type Zn finger protein
MQIIPLLFLLLSLFFSCKSSSIRFLATTALLDSTECKDGVCSINSTLSQSSLKDVDTLQTDNEEAVEQLMKLGWPEKVSRAALNVTNYDVNEAASLLDQEQEQMEQENILLKQLVEKDWTEEVALVALRENEGNITKADEMLQLEEKNLQESFIQNVQEMVSCCSCFIFD